jgi:hypothetical protein
MSTTVYNQQSVSVIVGGRIMSDLMEGTSITVTHRGGEVDITEGTDGPGLNRATDQGGQIKFTLKENSADYDYLKNIRNQQAFQSEASGNVVVTTGTRDIITISDYLISLPGERTTGDKKMAGVEFTIVGLVINDQYH